MKPSPATQRVRPHVWLLLGAICVGLIGDGAFDRRGALLFAMAVVIALTWALTAEPLRRADLDPLTAGLGLLALVAVVRAQFAGDVTDSLGFVVLVGTSIGIVLSARRTDPDEATLLLQATVALVCIEALAAVAGVASHNTGLAELFDETWRATATLGYPNAAAALFVPTALLALTHAMQRPDPRPFLALTALLLLGSIATLSRAAPLAFAVGLVVLVLMRNLEGVLRVLVPPLAGASLGGILLYPSISNTGTATSLLAVASLPVGFAATMGAHAVAKKLPRRKMIGVAAALVIMFGLVGGIALSTRAELGKSTEDRADEMGAAWRVFSDSPLVGAGPNQALLQWQTDRGLTLRANYAHNEYLQVAAELGLLGLAALVTALWGVVRIENRSRPWSATVGGFAVAAPLIAFGVHMGLDFVAHLPVIPGLMALWLGAVDVGQGRTER